MAAIVSSRGRYPIGTFTPRSARSSACMPAAGLLLTGSLGAAMPAGVALLMVLLAPVIAHVLSSRLRPVLALAMAVYLALILAAPANLGEDPKALSFAMFYNRICWVTLSLLLIMCLPPIRRASLARDGCSAALLALVTLYTKASFGLVALVVLVLMLLVREQRPWATIALATTAVLTLVLEIMWGLPSAYIRDLAQTAYATGAVQGGSAKLLGILCRQSGSTTRRSRLPQRSRHSCCETGAWRCFSPSAPAAGSAHSEPEFSSLRDYHACRRSRSRGRSAWQTRAAGASRRAAGCTCGGVCSSGCASRADARPGARSRLARIYGSPAPSPRIALPCRGSTG